MHRFFVPKQWFESGKVTISGEIARQISLVLRLKIGEYIVLLDNTGWEYDVRIEQVSSLIVTGNVTDKKSGTGEPAIIINLYQALLKVDKMEFVLQKCVELGVTGFMPFVSERSVAKEPSANKIERWQKIIREAAEQSGRALIPVLHPTLPFHEACKMGDKPSLLLWEKEQIIKLRDEITSEPFSNSQTINVFIGPEGGFSESEVSQARECGIIPVGLGRRILRAETAGLAAISAIMYERGELE